MSSNLLKMGYTTLQDSGKRMIDTNDLVAKRIEELAEKMSRPENSGFSESAGADGFTPGLDAERVESLLSDEETEEDAVIDLEQVRMEAERIIAEAKETAAAQQDVFMKAARAQIAQEKVKTMEQAKELGYMEGYKKAEAVFLQKEQALEAHKKAMEEEYEKILGNLEVEMVDALTGVYEHLFSVELSSYKDILVKLLHAALRKIDGGRDYIVHISPEDYPYVSMEKKQLAAALSSPSATLELVEDITLKHNECMIETDTGIFDCGLGTQLSELNRKLKLLSYERA